MGIHKKVKFPIEITKGKADDLYRLRFMRKSELEPNVRHNLKFYACQMDRQLDIWFREQLFTIGSLNKEQEKLNKSRVRIRQAIRLAKKTQYLRHQEEIRTKLHDIKIRIIMMKVVQKFKDNVRMNKAYRESSFRVETPPRGKVDFLRISGNRQFLHGKQPDGDSVCPTDCKDARDNVKRHSKRVNATAKNSECRSRYRQENSDENFDIKDVLKIENAHKKSAVNKINESFAADEVDGVTVKEHIDNNVCGLGGHVDAVSDDEVDSEGHEVVQGARMATIPEESKEDVEIEIDDVRVRSSSLSRRNLRLLNRRRSNRNIFNDHVTLLPEIRPTHAPLKADKETQDLLQKDKLKKEPFLKKLRKKQPDKTFQAKIIVKLPEPSTREDSAKSNKGNFGSESDDVNDDGNERYYGYGFESVISDSCSEYTDASGEESDLNVRHRDCSEEFSLTLTKYKATLRRKEQSNSEYRTYIQSLPPVTNLEADLPNVSYFHVQNPFSLKYKERSFFISRSGKDTDRPPGSARFRGRRKEPFSCDKTEAGLVDVTEESNGKTTDKQKSREVKLDTGDMADIQVFGRKPDGVPLADLPPPPNTPTKCDQGKAQRRPQKSNLNQVVLAQRRSKTANVERIHDIVMREPIQKYERSKSGKIKMFGTVAPGSYRAPSMKDHYFRDKLLKKERDTTLKQNMKMKRFMDTFYSGCSSAKLPPVADSATVTSPAISTTNSGKAFGGFLFKVHKSGDPSSYDQQQRKIIPRANTTSLRLLKNCRYLREYRPISDEDDMTSLVEKVSSWDMKSTSSSSSYSGNNYVANVRVSLA